jgi:hypothetical protein
MSSSAQPHPYNVSEALQSRSMYQLTVFRSTSMENCLILICPYLIWRDYQKACLDEIFAWFDLEDQKKTYFDPAVDDFACTIH